MLQTPSDEELLDTFVKSGNEQAFRRLAERYSGLIFHTALRSLNNRTLAEDVAQRVLGALGKKASQVARSNAPLPAWLHRTTILEAKSTLRSESRHHRKKEALMRAPADFSDSNDLAWQDALPHLDAAIDTLPEADRHVLLLHFVNEMTFPEIARRLGKSATAALGTTLLLCGIPLTHQQASISDLEAKLKNTKGSPQLVQTSSRRANSTSLSIPQRLARDLKAKDSDVPRYRGAVEYIEELNNEALISLTKETAASTMTINDRIVVIRTALETVADQDLETGRYQNPEAALNALMDHLSLEMVAAIQQSGNTLAHYLRSFSEKDGTRALAWFQGHLEQIRSLPEMRGASKQQLEN